MLWPEDRKQQKPAAECSVSQDELFVRKLVDATLLSGRLFTHLSHESDDREGEFIYVTPFQEQEPEIYGAAIQAAVNSGTVVSSRLDYLVWDGAAFQPPSRLFPAPTFKRDLSACLLNHYLVFGGITYEMLFSIYDPAPDRVVLFLKEADRDEQ